MLLEIKLLLPTRINEMRFALVQIERSIDKIHFKASKYYVKYFKTL